MLKSTIGLSYYSWPEPIPPENFKRLDFQSFIIITSFKIISILNVLIEYFIVWWKIPALPKILNNWNLIEGEIETVFSKNIQQRVKTDLKTCGKYLLYFYVLLASLIFGTIRIGFEINFNYPVHTFVLLIYTYFSGICYLMEDCKVVLLNRCIDLTFRRVIKL